MKTIDINLDSITDYKSFHKVFKEIMGFPKFYGMNMNAWIDCMSYINDAEAGMSKITINSGEVLTLNLLNIVSFKKRCPELYDDLIECSAFVNYRLIIKGEDPVLSLSFFYS